MTRDIRCRRSPGGRPVVEGVRHDWVVHSPRGFEWGYAGSGPSDLALNVLLLFTGDRTWAWSRRHAFKLDFIAPLPWSGGAIEASAVEAWIAARRRGGQGQRAATGQCRQVMEPNLPPARLTGQQGGIE